MRRDAIQSSGMEIGSKIYDDAGFHQLRVVRIGSSTITTNLERYDWRATNHVPAERESEQRRRPFSNELRRDLHKLQRDAGCKKWSSTHR